MYQRSTTYKLNYHMSLYQLLLTHLCLVLPAGRMILYLPWCPDGYGMVPSWISELPTLTATKRRSTRRRPSLYCSSPIVLKVMIFITGDHRQRGRAGRRRARDWKREPTSLFAACASLRKDCPSRTFPQCSTVLMASKIYAYSKARLCGPRIQGQPDYKV